MDAQSPPTTQEDGKESILGALTPRRPTVRKLFAPTKRYPTVPAVLWEARRQYPDAVAVFAHPDTIAAHTMPGVTEDRGVPVGLIEVEVMT